MTKRFKDNGLLLHFEHDQFQPGVWIPRGVIEDPETGETSVVTVGVCCYSEKEADRYVEAVAGFRIRNGTWRN